MPIGQFLEIDQNDNLCWIPEYYSPILPRIMRFNLKTSALDSVISLPIPDPTAASSITSLKFDKQQNLFVVIDNRILKYNMATKQASQLNIELFEPNGIAFDSEGSLYYSENGPLLVGDAYSYNIPRLRKINAPIKDSYFTPIP